MVETTTAGLNTFKKVHENAKPQISVDVGKKPTQLLTSVFFVEKRPTQLGKCEELLAKKGLILAEYMRQVS